MRIADHLHLPLSRRLSRQNVIINSFGVEVASCASMDYVAPLVHAANCHDDMLEELRLQAIALRQEITTTEPRQCTRLTSLQIRLDRLEGVIARAEGR